MKKYEKYILPGFVSLGVLSIILLLSANLGQSMKINETLSAIVPIVSRNTDDIKIHDQKLDNINVSVAKLCERASVPGYEDC
jgi:hypothetical protein